MTEMTLAEMLQMAKKKGFTVDDSKNLLTTVANYAYAG